MPSPITTPGYRYATIRYPANGVTTDWPFNFAGPAPGYLDASHISCFRVEPGTQLEIPIDPAQVSLIGPNTVRISPAVAAGRTVVIRRETPKEQPEVNFVEGGILNETNLDTTARQAVYAAAEMVDYFADLLASFAVVDELSGEAFNLAVEALFKANQALTLATTALANSETAVEDAAEALAAALAALAAANQAALDAAAAAASAAAAQAAAEAALALVEGLTDGATIAYDVLGTMEIAYNIVGKLNITGEEVGRFITARPFTVEAGTGAARGYVGLRIAPAADFTIQIFRNGTQIGTATVLSGQTSGTITIASTQNFVAGDTLSMSVSTGDTTAADLAVTMLGKRT